jgi:acetyl-CoA carboxylase carboxyltransferase component
VITASEATVKGGAINEWACREVAPPHPNRRAEPPAGHQPRSSRRRRSAEPVEDLRAGRARLSRHHAAQRSSGIPTICLVFGSSTAGGAYIPGMSDYVVMVEEQARSISPGRRS